MKAVVKTRLYPTEIETAMLVRIPDCNNLRGKMKDPITDKQKAFLHDLGVNTSGLRYKGQAMFVIDLAIRREKCGLASFAQIQTIRNLGINPTVPFSRLTSVGAKRIINKH